MPCTIITTQLNIPNMPTTLLLCQPRIIKRPSARAHQRYTRGLETLLYVPQHIDVISTNPPVSLIHVQYPYPKPGTRLHEQLIDYEIIGRRTYPVINNLHVIQQIIEQALAIDYLTENTEAFRWILEIARFNLSATPFAKMIDIDAFMNTIETLRQFPNYLSVHTDYGNYLLSDIDIIEAYYTKHSYLDVFITNNPEQITSILGTYLMPPNEFLASIEPESLAYILLIMTMIKQLQAAAKTTYATTLTEATKKVSLYAALIGKLLKCVYEDEHKIQEALRTLDCTKMVNASTVIRRLYDIRRLIQQGEIQEAVNLINTIIRRLKTQ